MVMIVLLLNAGPRLDAGSSLGAWQVVHVHRGVGLINGARWTSPTDTPMAQKRYFDVSFKLKAIECACRSLGLPYGRTNWSEFRPRRELRSVGGRGYTVGSSFRRQRNRLTWQEDSRQPNMYANDIHESAKREF